MWYNKFSLLFRRKTRDHIALSFRDAWPVLRVAWFRPRREGIHCTCNISYSYSFPRSYGYVYICLFLNIEIKTYGWHIQKSGVVLKALFVIRMNSSVGRVITSRKSIIFTLCIGSNPINASISSFLLYNIFICIL